MDSQTPIAQTAQTAQSAQTAQLSLLTYAPGSTPSDDSPPVYDAEAVADADFEAVTQGRAGSVIVLPEKATPADAIECVSRSIPHNEFGLPYYYYRSDLLPSLSGTITQDQVDAAAQDIFYYDGYPTLEDGRPFWGNLPHEPHEAFLLFQRWLDLAELEGIRLLDDLARRESTPLGTVKSHHKEFYWTARARAYDLFIVAAEAKKREHRIRKAENKHFDTAAKLLETLETKFNDDTWIDNLSAKEALDALETLVKIQRLSLGLTGAHASSNNNMHLQPGSSAEMVFRSISKELGGSSTEEGSNTHDQLQTLLSDPEAGMKAQELILRVFKHGGQNNAF